MSFEEFGEQVNLTNKRLDRIEAILEEYYTNPKPSIFTPEQEKKLWNAARKCIYPYLFRD
ncbi:hypothetical protein Barb6_02220 [Bacteroidales bacterium Barb6]|nr:hypothetical protein Barb6_02215 [Bacteroidales bacterium Barb6]OAV67917.1 hypothetical protein Barb6_02220 [Bacteroidales bacterium Barb6]